MADYKKKKFKKPLFHKKHKTHSEDKIFMTDKRQKREKFDDFKDEEIKVIRGSKFKRKRQAKIILCVIAFIAITFIVLSALLPGGLYENTVNFIATLGHGTYPTSVSGGSILNVISNDSYFYILSDTNITAYSSGGKIIFDELHGFSNPILSVSSTRALVYDQGGKILYIYNLNGKIHTLTTKKEIITASISNDGDFAVATHSDSYTSVATVYDRDFNEVYTWNSAKEIINNVLVNTSGNKLAVSTFNVISGQYTSKLMILDYESADPLHTLDLGNSLAIKIGNTGSGISVICDNKYKFLHWSDFNTIDINVSGEINSFTNNKHGVMLTVNRANDRSDNTIVLISKKGEKTSEFKISNFITDIQYNKGRVYSLCDTSINIYDKDGNILRSGNANYGTRKIAVISPNSVASIGDSDIYKIDIEEGED